MKNEEKNLRKNWRKSEGKCKKWSENEEKKLHMEKKTLKNFKYKKLKKIQVQKNYKKFHVQHVSKCPCQIPRSCTWQNFIKLAKNQVIKVIKNFENLKRKELNLIQREKK